MPLCTTLLSALVICPLGMENVWVFQRIRCDGTWRRYRHLHLDCIYLEEITLPLACGSGR
jgi:hypothetical protein